MKKTNQKGFTIVELVIVIAVIAILAAVLIPTFSNLVKKAHISNDVGTIANLNKAMALKEVTEGKPNTMYDALNAAADIGYTVEKLTPSMDTYYYSWNKTDNKFFLVKEDLTAYDSNITYLTDDAINCWMVAHKYADVETFASYSVYLANDFNVSEIPEEGLNISNGFDSCLLEGVEKINYVNLTEAAKEVTIRTNGGTLTINAPLDTVHHYGEVENLNIIAVHSASYHEYGKVGYAEITSGRFVVEGKSRVAVIYSAGNSADVKIDAKASSVVGKVFSRETNDNIKVDVEVTVGELTNEQKENLIYEGEATIVNTILVNGVYYKSLKDAFKMASVPNGNGYNLDGNYEIKLLRDIEDLGLFNENVSNIRVEIDFNGYTYTVNAPVGSSGTPTQAMHFNGTNTFITLKNGKLTTKPGTEGLKMALQNYANFTAINMEFDFTNIPVTYYPENKYSGEYAVYNGHEVSTFNCNKEAMRLENCTINFPEDALYSIGASKPINIINCNINGFVSIEDVLGVVTIDSASTVKGVKPYFVSDELSQNTENGNTVYTLIK